MYLVDTNIISAAAPSCAVPTALLAWMDAKSAALFLSVVTIVEIEDGIAKARRDGAYRKAAALGAWFETMMHLYAARILKLDVAVARAAGGLTYHARARGHAPGFADIAIAATAMTHGLTILSRNLRHFIPFGVPVHDPYEALPVSGL